MTALRIRLLLRLYRFEAVFFGVLALGAAAGLAVVTWRLPAVLRACIDPVSAACAQAEFENVLLEGMLGASAQMAVVALPILAGLLVGIACVGREVERGTTILAWSLGGHAGAGCWAGCSPWACASSRVGAPRGRRDPSPWQPRTPARISCTPSAGRPEASGLMVVARGMAAFGLGLLAGALMGRVLPAVLLSIVALFGCAVGVNMTLDAWVHDQAVVLELQRPWGSTSIESWTSCSVT